MANAADSVLSIPSHTNAIVKVTIRGDRGGRAEQILAGLGCNLMPTAFGGTAIACSPLVNLAERDALGSRCIAALRAAGIEVAS